MFGNVAWKENVVAHDAGEYLDEMYTYDSTGQLTGKASGLLNENCNGFESGTESSSQSWTLDALGNWIRANGATTDSTYNSSNENTAYTYDHNGNLTDDGTYTYVYDAWNRLVEVSNGSGELAEYQYDGQNRKTISRQATTTPGTLDSFTNYFYAGSQVVNTVTFASSGFIVYEYVYSVSGPNAVILRDTLDNSTLQPVAADRIYYLTDANGNITALCDYTGAVVERYVYAPYGAATIYYSADWSGSTHTDSAYGNTVRFAGMDIDTVTGLYYDRARWYNPSTGTFINRDPAEADANPYRYCGNNAISRTDPTGLDETFSSPPFSHLCPIPGMQGTIGSGDTVVYDAELGCIVTTDSYGNHVYYWVTPHIFSGNGQPNHAPDNSDSIIYLYPVTGNLTTGPMGGGYWPVEDIPWLPHSAGWILGAAQIQGGLGNGAGATLSVSAGWFCDGGEQVFSTYGAAAGSPTDGRPQWSFRGSQTKVFLCLVPTQASAKAVLYQMPETEVISQVRSTQSTSL